ncbi:MAG: DUF1700 domain-containing protein [Lachnospiraceae bacterium]|nr:DUF1700 domain-containing protein [Lachnospiraceae bacterium]
MTRQEFIAELRNALQGQVSAATISDSVQYYESYIMQESRKGRTEEEVIEELGNPRLIAKTIISSHEGEDIDDSNRSYDNSNNSRNQSSFGGLSKEEWKVKITKWSAIIAAILILVGIFAIVGGIISFLAPVLVPLLIFILIVRLISRF